MRRRLAGVSALLALIAGIALFLARVRDGAPPARPESTPPPPSVAPLAPGEPIAPPSEAVSSSPTPAVPEPPPLRDPERVSVVRGRIWLRSGASLEGSRVILWGGAFPGSPVDAEGRFEIRAPWEMATSCFLDRDGVRLLVMDQVLASFERDAVLEIEVDDGESIAIPVVDGGTGRPVAGARVALRGGQGQAGAVFGESDESGLFAASFLPAGEYTAEVTHPEFTPLTTRIDVPLPPARSSS